MAIMEKMNDKYATTHNVTPKCTAKGNSVNVSVDIQPVSVSADYVSTIQSYARTAGEHETLKYECAKCKYKTDRKCNYDVHVSGCGIKADKTLKCPICENNYIYRTLRHHLNHFASGKHITTNQHHSKYTPEEDQSLLDHLKTLKQMNKTQQI